MEDIVHTTQRIMHAIVVAHVTNIKLDFIALERDTHVFLLFFVATEHANFCEVRI